jgi:hypothetical protein
MQSWAGDVDLGRQAEDVQETGKPAARGRSGGEARRQTETWVGISGATSSRGRGLGTGMDLQNQACGWEIKYKRDLIWGVGGENKQLSTIG